MKDEIKIGGGLQPISRDDRDLSLGRVFNFGKIEDVPNEDFVVDSGAPIKDQDKTDFCTGYAVTDVSEDQEGEDLSPEFNFGSTKELYGQADEWGANLRDACSVPVKIGSIPQKEWDKVFPGKRYDRSVVVGFKNYPKEWKEIAKKYKKESYWAVTGQYDAFDNLRLALWANRADKRSAVAGIAWRPEWSRLKDGVIKKVTSKNGSGHAFNFVGQKIIKKTPYLVARLSNGTKIGDKGYFYFSREVVNAEVERYGLFMFNDMSKDVAKVLNEYGWKLNVVTYVLAKLVALLKIIMK